MVAEARVAVVVLGNLGAVASLLIVKRAHGVCPQHGTVVACRCRCDADVVSRAGA